MALLKFFLFVVIFLTVAASEAFSQSIIRMIPMRNSVPAAPDFQICESWKFSFEAGNVGNSSVPERCVEFVKQYIDRNRFLDDSYAVGEYSYEFAKTVKISSDSDEKDAWIFDIDETLLSNLPYYEEHGYGAEIFNESSFNEWVEKAGGPALPASLKLYKRLQNLGFKIILLTGRDEAARNSTQQNLLNAGYSNWVKLILRIIFRPVTTRYIVIIAITTRYITSGRKQFHVGLLSYQIYSPPPTLLLYQFLIFPFLARKTMAFLKPLLSVIILLAVTSPAVPYSSIRMFPTRNGDPPIPADEFCESWKFSFEAGNAGNSTVPGRCYSFLENYLYGKRYLQDSSVVAYYSYEFAKTVNISIISAAGKDAWIFDIDETLLSNLPYYEDHGYGSKTWDEIAFKEWVEKAEDRALPASMKLYKRLQKLGFKIILLTGRDESVRNSTQKNLLDVGYSDWVKLIMRGPHDKDKKAIVYKSEKRAELLHEGYILHGNSGDQWSDVSGYALATRSFKLPNPVYFIY